MFHKILHA